MDELQPVAVEVGHVGGVITGSEVGPLGWGALVDAPALIASRLSARGVDRFYP
jgi:hypothetical protein